MGMRNIDAEVEAIEALTASEERFRTVMASAPGGMAVIDLDGGFEEVNDALVTLVGRDREWLSAHGLSNILHPGDAEIDEVMRRRIQSGETETGIQECRLVRGDGTVVWVRHAVGLLRDPEGSSRAFVSQFVDVTAAKQARDDLEFLAQHDPLTRLANRRALVEAMGKILAHPPRAGMNTGLLFLDLDGLKPVNDRHGHRTGDELIVEVARRIGSEVRSDDLVARIGGDEFVVVLPLVRDSGDVVAIGEKIRRCVALPMETSGGVVHITASVGATLARPGEVPDVVIQRADHALYEAKQAGRNRTVAHDASWNPTPGE